MWSIDVWKRRKCFVPLIAHIFDQITDVSVAIQFLLLSQNTSVSQNDWEACNGLNMRYLFILTILSMIIYRMVSSYLLYQVTKSIQRIFSQLLDLELLRALHVNYLCNNVEPCSPQRWLTALEATLESSPQALIQMIYLIKTGTFDQNYLVVISLISSLWSIVSKLISDDKVIVVSKAKSVNFHFGINIIYDLLYIIFVPIFFAICIVGTLVVFIIALVMSCICCCCAGCAYIIGETDDYHYEEWQKLLDIEKATKERFVSVPTKIDFGLSQRFLWVSWTYILRVLWRILDVTSHLLVMTLIWVAIGGTALTFKVVMESLAFLVLCVRTKQWEFLFGVVALVISTINRKFRDISICIAVYRTLTNIIFMSLVTVWFYVDFECWRCTKYQQRQLEINSISVYSLFIYTWIAIVISPICILVLVATESLESKTSTSRNLAKMIEAKNYNGILEMQLYSGQYHIYDHRNKRTLLMLAMQEHKPAIISFLLQHYEKDGIEYDEQDIFGDNMLDFYVKVMETDHQRMTNNLIKIHKKHPTLKSARERYTIFLSVCYHGNMHCVQELIKIDKNVINDTTINNLNAATLALLTGNKDITSYFQNHLKLHHDLSCVSQHTSTDKHRNALDYVLESKNASYNILSEILQTNPHLTSTNKRFSPFLCACHIGDIDVVKKLIGDIEDPQDSRFWSEISSGIECARKNNDQNMIRLIMASDVFRELQKVSKAETVASDAINLNMKKEERVQKQAKTLLLLGSQNSGASTLFKNLKITTKTDSEVSEWWDGGLQEAVRAIRSHCISGLLMLLKKSQELYDENSEENVCCLVHLDDETVSAIKLVYDYVDVFEELEKAYYVDEFEELEKAYVDEFEELGNAIDMLWGLDAVRRTFDLRGAKYSFPDNMDHFFDKVREIMSDNYNPTEEDLLRAKIRTTGIIEYTYDIKDTDFVVYNVEGLRNEKSKWLHQFAEVDAVVFVAALDQYNEGLPEDRKTNAMHEAIEYFGEISNSKLFQKSEIILFLNKDDVFRHKLSLQIYLNRCFSTEFGWNDKQWDGPNYQPIIDDEAADKHHYDECYESAIKFIKDAFISRSLSDRVIFCHVTTATDKETVQKVFWDVGNIVRRSVLKRNTGSQKK